MANKRTTKREYFEMLKNIEGVKSNTALVEFIDHEIELLAKKNSSEKKPTKTQVENEVIKTAIFNGMADGQKYRIVDLVKNIAECNELTGQKVSALVRQMITEGKVVRTTDKSVAYFAKVGE